MFEIDEADRRALYEMARNALDRWEIQAEDLKLVRRGENVVFKVNTGKEDVALRIHRPGYHTLDELNAEHTWTAALQQSGLDVPTAIQGPHGDFYIEIEDLLSHRQCYSGIVEWIDGEILGDILSRESGKFSLIEGMRRLGNIAARIHNQAANWQIPASFTRQSLDAEGLMGEDPFWGPFWELPELSSQQQAQFSQLRQILYERLNDYGKDPQHYSMIHADLNASNIMVQGDHLFVFDFDDAGFGWHMYELAVALYSVLDHADYAAAQTSLFEGYRELRDLPKSDLAYLPVFLLVRSLASLGWVHHRPELGRDYIKPLIELSIQQARDLDLWEGS
jgi:Ser/Thr protein kinase RdoA (MazF antagonist)